jgi:hypothetical protein
MGYQVPLTTKTNFFKKISKRNNQKQQSFSHPTGIDFNYFITSMEPWEGN